jgi:chemotaxis methyl-accepting protein methylase
VGARCCASACPRARVPFPEAQSAVTPEVMAAVLGEVARRRGVDFRDYRRETLERGILHRMQRMGETSAARYAESLGPAAGERGDEELAHLLEALVVPSSAFFRDAPVWEAVADKVLPRLALAHLEQRPLRAWCVGAATGEEVWSLAMLLAERCDGPAGPAWELHATDLDRRTLKLAEEGRYAPASAASVPAQLRARYLHREGDDLVPVPALRARVSWSYHDLLGATLAPVKAVIAAFDLVLVRNVLIYFERRLQEKALHRLQAVLQPGGALVLGQVETLPPALERQLACFPGTEPGLRIFLAGAA